MSRELTVQTPTESYPVYVGQHVPVEPFLRQVDRDGQDDPVVIMDEVVARHHLSQVRTLLGNRFVDERLMTVPSGEASKSITEWSRLSDGMLNLGVRRNTPVVVIGGGVTGDLGGFVASTTMRGLPLIHMPTTLLAMVDSSIGGKTGINHTTGKNLIGSFYQPKAIFMNTGFLETLPEKEWINGLSEILKYGAIRDPKIFHRVESLFLQRDPDAGDPDLIPLIHDCATIKASVVAEDEKESGLRMILNFGHTFGHALERHAGYRNLSHGEAVYIGMLAAVHLSNHLGGNLDPDQLLRFRSLYNPSAIALSTPVDKLVKAMYQDKKRSSNRLKVVLLESWGEPIVRELGRTEPVVDAWKWALNHFDEESVS
ncbi:MAG: 3-dehydroquinate synthase [Balneolaceae bacterium]